MLDWDIRCDLSHTYFVTCIVCYIYVMFFRFTQTNVCCMCPNIGHHDAKIFHKCLKLTGFGLLFCIKLSHITVHFGIFHERLEVFE